MRSFYDMVIATQLQPVSLGIIGCGVIGKVHLQHASQSPLIRLQAVADVREAVACEAVEKFGVARMYTDPDALLRDSRVEAVVLALPTAGRAELALRALACGKDVLVEKPVGMNAAEVRRMMAARGDRVVGCCQSRMRHNPAAQVATQFIGGGGLGDLRLVRCRASSAGGPPPARPAPSWRLNKLLNGGGILMNWGSYDLDYLLGLTRWKLKPRHALAQTWPVPPAFAGNVAPGSDAETHAAALITCEGGTVISIERGEHMPAVTDEAWQIIGSKGALRLPMIPGQNKKLLFDEAVAGTGVVTRTLWEGEDSWDDGHRGVLADFVAAVRERRPPLASLEQALVVQQITDAIYASAETGAAVEIN